MKVGELFVRLALDNKQYERDLDRMKGVTEKKALTLGNIFKQGFSFALGIGLISGFRSLGGAITDFINTAARTEVLDIAMQSVARSSGYAVSALQEQRKTVMDLGIAEQEATQILTRFMQAQLDTADAAKLARVAQDAAVIAGSDSSQAAEQMTEAIAKQRPELLSAFGMTRNMNEIYNDYARTIGRTVGQLTEAQKKQAMLNYILKEGEKIAGTYEASMGAVGKQITSLPRLWDTLKNALAKPLALPAISVIVDGITNALKNAISWAEANKIALQMWGQVVANAAKTALKWAWAFGSFIARNWGTIAALVRTVGIAFLSYYSIASVLNTLSLATKILAGELVTTNIILGFVSRAFGIYRLQINLASAAGIAHVGVLAAVRTALYSVWAALGPIGWAILGITGLLTAGIYLWNRYTQSLQNATKAAPTADMFKRLREGAQGAAEATEDQADAITNLGKASKNNLQSFDEFHELTKDAADIGDMDLDAPTLDDLVIPDLGGIDDMLAGFELAKPTIGGFWDWIKQGFASAWEWIKEKTGLTWWEMLGLISGPVGMIAVLIYKNWGRLKEWAGNLWDDVKEKWGNFKTWLAGWWNEHVAPWFTKAKWLELYSTINTSLRETWDSAVTWWNSTALGKWWNEHVAPWFTKEKWLGLYDNMSLSLQETWGKIVTWWQNTALVKWWREHVAPWFTKAKWLELYAPIKTSLEDIWADVEKWWNGTLLGKAFKWGKNLITNIVDGIDAGLRWLSKTVGTVGQVVLDFLGFSSPTRKGPGRTADEWAPNLMRMYSKGILSNVSMVQSAAGVVAQSLAPMTAQPSIDLSVGSSSLKDSILEALMQKEIVTGGSGSQEFSITLTLENGEVLADLLIDPINRTAKNRGYAPVFKPAT